MACLAQVEIRRFNDYPAPRSRSTVPSSLYGGRAQGLGAVRETEEHGEPQTLRDAFGALDKDRRGILREEIPNSLAEDAEPDVEVLLGHVLEFQMGWNRPSLVVAGFQDDRAPEIRHLLEVRLPVTGDFPCEDRTQPLIPAQSHVEFPHQDPDGRPGDVGLCERFFGDRPGFVDQRVHG